GWGWVSGRGRRAGRAGSAPGGYRGRRPAVRPARRARIPAFRQRPGAWGSGAQRFALGLLELGLDAALLQVGQVLDEHLAVEMIELVLHAHRQQAVGLGLVRLAVDIQRLVADARRALDLVVDARHRQAAFLVGLALVALPGDLGVDQHAQL